MVYPYFTVYLTNMQRDLDGQFTTIEDARKAGEKTGFDFGVMLMYGENNGELVGFYNVLSGWHSGWPLGGEAENW